MKNILVPCDFSQPAQQAFKMAIDIASKTNGRVIVLYVIYMPPTYDPNIIGDPASYNPQLITDAENEAKKAFESMQKDFGKSETKAELVILTGLIAESINRVVEKNKIDLILMGTNGSSGLREFFIGSNTEKVVRYSKVPVLAIHTAPSLSSIKNILVPVTGDLNQTKFAHALKELQEFLKAKLHVLMINTPVHFRTDAEAMRVLEDYVNHYKFTNYELYFRNYTTEEEGILDFAATQKSDLIVMATHARKGLAHLFAGSITENVVNHVTAPVWTFALKA